MRWTKKISKNYELEKDIYNKRKAEKSKVRAMIREMKHNKKEEKDGQTD